MSAQYIQRITDHDPTYHDGSLCRGLFSGILYDLQDFVFQLQPQDTPEDKEVERLTNIIIRQKLEEVAREIWEIHNQWLYPDETGPDALRAKDHSHDWDEELGKTVNHARLYQADTKQWPTQIEGDDDDN